MRRPLRNIAIIAHVDHGKTTLVDKLLQQAGTFAKHQHLVERVMDSNDIERERGITILAKNTAVDYHGVHINIVDTPGHADFGGEVERVLSMVDGVLLLVDAVEGPMPQTRFVTRKALAHGTEARSSWSTRSIATALAPTGWWTRPSTSLDKLGATEEQLDFPVIYASAPEWLGLDRSSDEVGTDMRPLFDAVLEVRTRARGRPRRAAADADRARWTTRASSAASRSAASAAARSEGAAKSRSCRGDKAMPEGQDRQCCVPSRASSRSRPPSRRRGEIVSVTGIEDFVIGTTFADPQEPEGAAHGRGGRADAHDEFPGEHLAFAGQEGKYVTSRQIRERLERELLANVALRVEETEDADVFRVSGRGELHLADPDREHAPRGLRGRGGQAARRGEGDRRRAHGAVGERSPSTSTDEPGQGHGGARAPRRRAAGHGAGRQGARAPGLQHSVARAHRLPAWSS